MTCHPEHFPASQYEYHSYEQNKHVPLVDAARMHLYWNNYLPNADASPLASPLLAASLENLPPARMSQRLSEVPHPLYDRIANTISKTVVQVAGMDPLRDEGLAYAEALEKSGQVFFSVVALLIIFNRTLTNMQTHTSPASARRSRCIQACRMPFTSIPILRRLRNTFKLSCSG